MRWSAKKAILLVATALLAGCSVRVEKMGLDYSGETSADKVRLLVDETWIDANGDRHVDQEIFDSVFSIIDEADEFILIDFFLVNDFLYNPGPGMRPLSQELTDRLVAKRKSNPDVKIIFITDPINTVYGSIVSPQFKAMKEAGVDVVWTDLDRLRDSNPLYSRLWRLLARPWGVGPGNALENPFGEGRISMRSMLKLLNFKANHRKVIVSEKSLLVASANPHSASSAHGNVALRIDGGGMQLACEAESAILKMSGANEAASFVQEVEDWLDANANPQAKCRLELLTEHRIEEKALELLNHAEAGDRIDLAMFYLSDRDEVSALIKAHKRGCDVRVVLDPNKDAFGRTKNGIPNRQTALKLVGAGIPVRWADTHGEQFHVKMLYVEHADGTATILLGSCNYTRRNIDNFNAECDVALAISKHDDTMVKARETFDRWWSNPAGRDYTTGYATYADPSRLRVFRAWLMETTGLSSF